MRTSKKNDKSNLDNFYHDLYLKDGFFVVRNFLAKKLCRSIIREVGRAEKTYKYYDRNNLIRRIENIYDKGKSLRLINKNLMNLLDKIFKQKYTIFKDKYNAKPPGGEGFFAHYDGVFQFRNKLNKLENGWYKYGKQFVNILVPLDPCNKKNGTIEVSKAHKNNFFYLLKNTNKDGTPNLKMKKNINSKQLILI